VQSKFVISTLCILFFSFSIFAQEEKDENEEEKKENKYNPNADEIIVDAVIDTTAFNPLSPAKAAFYSAILPGLGQAYNRRYWKIPVIYAALGTGIYFYIDNTNQYNRYRDAYKRRLAGFKDDEFYGTVTDDGLRNAQETFNTNREISLFVTIGIYVLNIIDANVDAHLLQYNVDDNLSLRPHYKINEFDLTSDLGLTLNFKF
jgi:hypothetical protein